MSIRRVNASTVLRQAATFRGQPWGVEAGENGVDNPTFAHLVNCFNTALETAWADAPVPEILRVERRQRCQTTFYSGDASGTTIAASTQVYDPETKKSWINVRAISGVEPLNIPGSAPSLWVELKRSWEDGAINFNLGSVSNTAAVGDVYRYSGDGSLGGSYWYCYASGPASYLANPSLRAGVFYQLPTFNPDFGRDVAWHTPMGFVLGVWNGNPETDDPDVLPLSYEITDDGVRVFEDPGEAWFNFTTVPPALFGAPWSASTAYAIGDQVYYQSGNTGDFYNVIAATTAGDTPLSAPAKFSVVEIPARYTVWLQYQIAADWYEFDDKMEDSLPKRGMAEREWKRLKYVLNRRERQSGQLNVQIRS